MNENGRTNKTLAATTVPAKAATAGLAAASLALSFLWVAAAVSDRVRFPPSALADRLVRVTPGDIATIFIELLQHNAMRLFVLALTIAFLWLGRRLPRLLRAPGAGTRKAAAAFGLANGAALIVAPRASLLAVAGEGIASALLYGLALGWILKTPEEPQEHGAVSRRQALALIGGGALALTALGTALGRVIAHLAGPNTVVPLRAADEIAAIPTNPARAAFPTIDELSPELTSAARHYVVDIDIADPIVDVASWQLRISGLVKQPLVLRYGEMQRTYKLVEQYSVLTCISNMVGGSLIGNSKWTGIRLRDVLKEASVADGAVDIVFRSADGYHSSLPVAAAMDPNVLLAIAQNGEPLLWEHGFPCRLRAPAFYGVKNAKWLTAIEAVGSDHADFWTERGWTDIAEVRTESKIDTQSGPFRTGEATWLAGVAWAGDRGISRVEVSVDGGQTWEQAMLKPPISALSWTQWAYRWTPARAGDARIQCRATDGHGTVQDKVERAPHPSGASGYEEATVGVS